MNRARNVIRDGGWTVRGRFSAFASQSPRTILLGTILLASALSAVMAFILAQYCSIDAFSSLVYAPQDCSRYWAIRVGRHCFSDYTEPMTLALRPNPWEPYPGATGSINYPPGALVPHLAFGLLGKLLHAPLLGLFGYLLASTLAVLTPGWWAARGARGLERVVVFVACGAAAIPAWAAIDRANSVVFVVPIALVFLVALCRQRWGLVVIMVVLAALVKPQFAVLGVVLFAARQWRMGGIAVAGGVVSNLAAYLLWPRDFPDTITQSIRATVGAFPFDWLTGLENVSFGRALLAIPDAIAALHNGGKVPDGYLLGPRLLAGYAVVIVVTGSLLALGRRIPPVMAGTVLLATASLFPAMTNGYYLVFVLPIAAVVVRDPDGPPGSRDLRSIRRPRRSTSRSWYLRECCHGADHRADLPAQPAHPWADQGADGGPRDRRLYAGRRHHCDLDAILVADCVRDNPRRVRAKANSLTRRCRASGPGEFARYCCGRLVTYNGAGDGVRKATGIAGVSLSEPPPGWC